MPEEFSFCARFPNREDGMIALDQPSYDDGSKEVCSIISPISLKCCFLDNYQRYV